MSDGTMTPCQWSEVGTSSRFLTRTVMVSPSRQRRSGPGTWPLIAVAIRLEPVKFTSSALTSRSNSVPDRTARRSSPAATRREGSAAVANTPDRPWTKRRRVRQKGASAEPGPKRDFSIALTRSKPTRENALAGHTVLAGTGQLWKRRLRKPAR